MMSQSTLNSKQSCGKNFG